MNYIDKIGRIYKKSRKHSDETKKKLSSALTGQKHSEETKKKMSEIGKRRQQKLWADPEYRKKMSVAQKGKILSEETKKKISHALSGKGYGFKKGITPWNKGATSDEDNRIRAGVHHPRYGKHPTEETLEKQSNSHKGIKQTEEQNRKRSVSLKLFYQTPDGINEKIKQSLRLKGKKVHTEETKQYFSQLYKGKPRSPETIKKMSEAMMGHKFPIERNKKISNFLKTRPISPKTGYGKHIEYKSPLQGIITLRSSYELAYAQYLDSIHEIWFYELWRFDLGDTSYTPDFYIPRLEKFIEIKGYMLPYAEAKLNKFKDEYPHEQIDVLYGKDLIALGCNINIHGNYKARRSKLP